MAKEIPIFLEHPSGKMFILEHHPETVAPQFWVISLNSGLLCRSGPRRLYVAFARRLAELGIGVVRVDLPGVGDSDGPGPEINFDMHSPQDVDVIVRYVREKHNPKGIILHGLCAGARAAIKAAAQDTQITAVVAWSTSILTTTPGMPDSPESPEHGVSRAVAKYEMGRVSRIFRELKFLKPDFWRRHLSSPKFLSEIKRTFWSAILFLRRSGPTKREGIFVRSLRSYTTNKRPIQFLYGERDNCAIQELRDLTLTISDEDLVIIPNGTHTLSTASQKKQAIDITCTWIQQLISSVDDQLT